MKLSEYDDEEILEEVKHRGFKIEMWDNQLGQPAHDITVKIGGIEFNLNSAPKHGSVPNADCLAAHNCITCKHNSIMDASKDPCQTCLSVSCQYEQEK